MDLDRDSRSIESDNGPVAESTQAGLSSARIADFPDVPLGSSTESDLRCRPSLVRLFWSFLQLGMTGFGGVLPVARHVLVTRRGWLSEREFTELLGLCQLLPGGNIINMSVAVGLRFRGVPGALAGLLGLIAAPSAIVIAMGAIYDRYHSYPSVGHMFTGLAAAAAGLLVSTAVKLGSQLRGNREGIFIALLCFGAIAIARCPLLPTIIVLVPVSMVVTTRVQR